MSDGREQDGTETEQRYEYSYESIGGQQHRGPSVIDKKSKDGWQLVKTLGVKGTSEYLVFERPVKADE